MLIIKRKYTDTIHFDRSKLLLPPDEMLHRICDRLIGVKHSRGINTPKNK